MAIFDFNLIIQMFRRHLFTFALLLTLSWTVCLLIVLLNFRFPMIPIIRTLLQARMISKLTELQILRNFEAIVISVEFTTDTMKALLVLSTAIFQCYVTDVAIAAVGLTLMLTSSREDLEGTTTV